MFRLLKPRAAFLAARITQHEVLKRPGSVGNSAEKQNVRILGNNRVWIDALINKAVVEPDPILAIIGPAVSVVVAALSATTGQNDVYVTLSK
jgi:hypothetical protein